MKIGTTTRNCATILNWNSGCKSSESTKRQSRYMCIILRLHLLVFHLNKRNLYRVCPMVTLQLNALFSPLHPQLNTTANQDVLHMQRLFTIFKIMTVTCICLAFYLIIVSCQYKAIPDKTVHADDTHMIISASCLTWQKIKVWKRVGKLTVQPV